MHINCHAHVFNFKSVFTGKSLEILFRRLRRGDVPEWLKTAATDHLRRVIVEGQGPALPDSDRLLADLAARLGPGGPMSAVTRRMATVRGLEGLGTRMESWLARLPDRLTPAAADARRKSVLDLIEFLRIGLHPTIRDVARILMDQLAPDEATVALMMDITSGPDDSEPDPFQRQMLDTSDLIRVYPGRIFPFVAANPVRPGFMERVRSAVGRLGFVGVKLYPSLDERFDWKGGDRLFGWCERHEVPLMVHCNDKGFDLSEVSAGQSDPDKWRVILAAHPKLRVCFGHFGGDADMTARRFPDGGWTRIVLDLMRDHAGVYADVSFHPAAMGGGAGARRYFERLGGWIRDPAVGGRILFGSDFYLIRPFATESFCWALYRKHLAPEDFDRIAGRNAAAYLGLEGPDGAPAANIRRHLRFLARNASRVEARPAPWAIRAIESLGGPPVEFPVRPAPEQERAEKGPDAGADADAP